MYRYQESGNSLPAIFGKVGIFFQGGHFSPIFFLIYSYVSTYLLIIK